MADGTKTSAIRCQSSEKYGSFTVDITASFCSSPFTGALPPSFIFKYATNSLVSFTKWNTWLGIGKKMHWSLNIKSIKNVETPCWSTGQHVAVSQQRLKRCKKTTNSKLRNLSTATFFFKSVTYLSLWNCHKHSQKTQRKWSGSLILSLNPIFFLMRSPHQNFQNFLNFYILMPLVLELHIKDRVFG